MHLDGFCTPYREKSAKTAGDSLDLLALKFFENVPLMFWSSDVPSRHVLTARGTRNENRMAGKGIS